MGSYGRAVLALTPALLASSCELVASLDGLAGDAAAPRTDATVPVGGPEAGESSAGDASASEDVLAEAGHDAASEAPADAPLQSDAPLDAAAEAGDAQPDAPSSVYRAAVLADSPLAYWRLGETSGTVAHDETGHGNDGTYVGPVILSAPGALVGDSDTAVFLDGVSSSIDVGNKFDFAGQLPFSLEAWTKPAVIDAQYRHIVAKMAYDNSGNPHEGTYVFLHQGSTTLGFERWSNGGAVLVVGTAALPGAGSWAHVVATYDGSIGTLYVDGVAVQARTALSGVLANGVHMLWGDVLQGELDEIAVYDHVLAPARVAAHWQAAQ